ncbi:hypothetical protein DICPUDRAFT_159737 [Dictyostelium purpureum]|uniref:non-specific serine/threonine protein kinase n=1 Tax=Dictyostelium purpureum TaxID=5786 RepID=F1A4V5_DICPU|nr:uncharacterized protein DICPUDRAFT_159737 [Dictyostelium purpureum]EGC28777.1 hypothetical protein DICPUDRAFT_159737 [Dictyostelium purpureum]|eukprot:XP_003294701.1 hypothetical protein DICPUDRAFT_159737 [Dictyostelium purpureum]
MKRFFQNLFKRKEVQNNTSNKPTGTTTPQSSTPQNNTNPQNNTRKEQPQQTAPTVTTAPSTTTNNTNTNTNTNNTANPQPSQQNTNNNNNNNNNNNSNNVFTPGVISPKLTSPPESPRPQNNTTTPQTNNTPNAATPNKTNTPNSPSTTASPSNTTNNNNNNNNNKTDVSINHTSSEQSLNNVNNNNKEAEKPKGPTPNDYTPLDFVDSSPKIDSAQPKRKASGPPEILPEEIDRTDFLGQGSFGSVYKGKCRGQEVAVKIPRKQKLSLYELTSFRHEVKIMSKIFHPNVVLFLGACTQSGKMQIVTELCQTDLEKLLHNDRTKKEFTLFRRMQMAKDAALGMNWLHGITRIVHNDLKTANLLVDINLRVKVTDFGFSQIKEGEEFQDKAAKGTPLWMAPEVMMGNPYNEKADVYSFGIILWEILTKEAPYSHHKDYDIFFNAICHERERPPIPIDTLPSLRHLIQICWDHNPQNRPSFSEILFRLNEILIDCAIDLDDGRKFWKDYFLVPKQELQEEVEWADFEKTLKQIHKQPNFDYSPLKELLVQQSHQTVQKTKQVVTMDRFDKVAKWFGPFYDPNTEIIENINKLSAKVWFHGDIGREQATSRLSKSPEGSFLIRLSSTEPKTCPFTLSMKNNQHRRIQLIDENNFTGFKIQGKTAVYNSLIELVEKCNDYPLLVPCPKFTQENFNPYDPFSE